jgi:hypothetical protein
MLPAIAHGIKEGGAPIERGNFWWGANAITDLIEEIQETAMKGVNVDETLASMNESHVLKVEVIEVLGDFRILASKVVGELGLQLVDVFTVRLPVAFNVARRWP